MYDYYEIWDEFEWEEFIKRRDKVLDRYSELFYRRRGDIHCDGSMARDIGGSWMFEDFHNGEYRLYPEHEEWLEGEEWKAMMGSESEEISEPLNCVYCPAYRQASEFTGRAVRFAERLPDTSQNDSSVVDFVSSAMIASTRLVEGTCLGYDVEELGGNIAFCKRALAASNQVLPALREMMERKILGRTSYLGLLEEATEVRNAIAVYILELRERLLKRI